MKGLICYYSNTGNTLLACRYLAGKCAGIEFDFHDLARAPHVDPAPYDIVGFAAFADFWGPSAPFVSFVSSLPVQNRKPAFVFCSYGSIRGGTLSRMVRLVTRKGFAVIAAHALHMPENIPIMILAGCSQVQAPDAAEMRRFNTFLDGLHHAIKNLGEHQDISGVPPFRLPWAERLAPVLPRCLGRWVMGPKRVDPDLCTACGLCVRVCPSRAISLKGTPVFDQARCSGCWACYNLCPQRAVYTRRYRGVGHYPGPVAAVKEKLTF